VTLPVHQGHRRLDAHAPGLTRAQPQVVDDSGLHLRGPTAHLELHGLADRAAEHVELTQRGSSRFWI
jgi:hypothetical protein